MTCKAKHVKYEPTDEEWCCPNCGAGITYFTVWESVSDDDYCKLVHNNDFCSCENCGYECSGKEVSDFFIKKNSMVPCSCCKGKGLVKRKEIQDAK